MPEGHDTIIEVSNFMSFVLYTQILKQSVLKPASPGITLNSANETWSLPGGTIYFPENICFLVNCLDRYFRMSKGTLHI